MPKKQTHLHCYGWRAGAFTTCVTLLPFFQTKRFRPFRAGLFAGLGLWGVFPAMHALFLHGAAPAVRRFFVLDMLMGAVYLVRCMKSFPCCRRFQGRPRMHALLMHACLSNRALAACVHGQKGPTRPSSTAKDGLLAAAGLHAAWCMNPSSGATAAVLLT